jgi:DNA-binding transcriptional LysR family regulator
MNLPEIRLMQAVVALAEELNYRRAAQKLNIVQSTLSKQIIELEHQLGYPLFIRSNQHVELTEAGRFFVQEARETLFHATRAVQNVTGCSAGSGIDSPCRQVRT